MTTLPLHTRIPTGALRALDDWPGLFVRGDDCFLLHSALVSVLAGDYKHPSIGYLKDILRIINKEVLGKIDGLEEPTG